MLVFASFALLIAAASACNNICRRDWTPLCGTDGRTYANRCELDSFNCRRKSAIAVAYSGECRRSAAAPVCNTLCTMNWQPVCGTDGKTYGNRCSLDSEACRTRNAVSFAHEGECRKTTSCQSICNFNWAPVCGSDGRTYGNSCELKSLACKARKSVTIVHNGECRKATPKTCNRLCRRNWQPVCGTDGKTYGNSCELQSAACLAKSALTIAKNGPCSAAKTCQRVCRRNWAPVCGSDGKTYGNSCALESAACLNKSGLRLIKNGAC